MANYYNKTRTPLAVALLRGGSVVLAPKQWVSIAIEDEGSGSLLSYVRKGFVAISSPSASNPEPVAALDPIVKIQKPASASDPVLISKTETAEPKQVMQEMASIKSNRKGR